MKRRDARAFGEAVSLFEDAHEQLVAIETTVPFKIALIYDMALAYDLADNRDRARQLFRHCCDLYDQLAADSPEDPAVEGFAGLIWGVNDYLSLWNNTNPNEDNYLTSINVRNWAKDNLPLKIFVDSDRDTGFDTNLQQLIFSGFQDWLEAGSGLSAVPAATRAKADISVIRVGDELGSAGGHTGFQDIIDKTGQTRLVKVTVRIALHSWRQEDLSELELTKLKSLAIHEAGHALGLDGHSPFATDLMYWKSPLLKLSERDKRTLQLAYSAGFDGLTGR